MSSQTVVSEGADRSAIGPRWGRGVTASLALAASMNVVDAPTVAASPQTIDAGRQLAETLCAECHAIGLDEESPFPPAPAFRDIAQRYSVWMLQEALAEGIVVGHDAMPVFVLSPTEIGQLLSYMEDVGVRSPAQD